MLTGLLFALTTLGITLIGFLIRHEERRSKNETEQEFIDRITW
ncbi:hypothetical protein SAMN05446927_5384 [Caballeronia arationis]|uniref:Uncharacterized protein n=1 Tax=Caballeronia arationis TaxID=1777142 RepID=A0A7Z7N4K5_9BURK|nr:hypothetical protein SAMN05446927_5384 [Caballeronia arationis]